MNFHGIFGSQKIWGWRGVRYFNFRYESEKSAYFSNMWGQNYLFFEIHTLNNFLLFLTKSLFLNFIILMGKAYEINQKKYFFDILKYGWFRWNSWQKVFFIFISFTIVNTKSVVLTTVNTYRFSKILPLVMTYLQIVQFSVCFTIVIF